MLFDWGRDAQNLKLKVYDSLLIAEKVLWLGVPEFDISISVEKSYKNLMARSR